MKFDQYADNIRLNVERDMPAPALDSDADEFVIYAKDFDTEYARRVYLDACEHMRQRCLAIAKSYSSSSVIALRISAITTIAD